MVIPIVSLKPKPQLSTVLIKVFEHRVINIKQFPSIIDIGHIHCFVLCYKWYIKSYKAMINGICYYYRFFVYLLLLVVDLKLNFVIVTVLGKTVKVKHNKKQLK